MIPHMPMIFMYVGKSKITDKTLIPTFSLNLPANMNSLVSMTVPINEDLAALGLRGGLRNHKIGCMINVQISRSTPPRGGIMYRCDNEPCAAVLIPQI